MAQGRRRAELRRKASGDLDAPAWTSPEGISWSRVPHDKAVFDDADVAVWATEG